MAIREKAREYEGKYSSYDLYNDSTLEQLDEAETVINFYANIDNGLWKGWRIAKMYQFIIKNGG